MISMQETFDKAAVGLLNQGKKSISGGWCRFRGPDGTRCTMGFLFEDEDYNPLWDDGTTEGVEASLDYFEHKGFNMALLISLRNIHDRYSPKIWKRMLYNLAEYFKLSNHALKQWEAQKALGPMPRYDVPVLDSFWQKDEFPSYQGDIMTMLLKMKLTSLANPKQPEPILPIEEKEPEAIAA